MLPNKPARLDTSSVVEHPQHEQERHLWARSAERPGGFTFDHNPDRVYLYGDTEGRAASLTSQKEAA